MASRIAQLYQGPVDRRISIDGIESAARAFERFRSQRNPINALAMQGMLPHDVDGVVQESRGARRDRSGTDLRSWEPASCQPGRRPG